MTFAEQLQNLRQKAGITQAALATATGLSLGIIRDYEQGRKEPAMRSAFRLAEALGVSCEAFKGCFPESEPEAASAEPRPRGRPRKAEASEGKGAKRKKGKGS